jgi:cell division protein FtsL
MLRYPTKSSVCSKSSWEKYDVDEKEAAAQLEKSRQRAERYKNPNVTPSKRGSWFIVMIIGAFVLAAIVFVLDGKIKLSEVNAEHVAASARIERAQRENDRLKTVLEGMVTPAKVEEYAAQNGLIKERVSQVTHIVVNVESIIEVAENRERDILGVVNGWFSNMLEFLGF